MSKINKPNSEWKKILDELTYKVTREAYTETPFSGKYLNEKSKGLYNCVCCGNTLFSSNTKFDSGSGWPSFYEPINNEKILNKDDFSHGMKRTEVTCSQCESHLGHVFEDGPKPSGLRYCLNSVSLIFKKDSE
ncbi:MAG: Peptide methionine sulfoxide reductase MsrB [Alphaproteobacteria bacterium MarineAlpha5_Bin12]|nr:MAG: Peptide methionine sulfoxide reductase MsrB [Alphaproteobacteria bacterium MarineAlpha5_Bin12]|tara:strand:- start:26335 stop:26733 length:399 start_codon:yes stop_codon:yes gene_type:complete